MKTRLSNFVSIGLVAVAIIFSAASASAQITINLPKIPKIKKEKPQPSPTTTTTSSDGDRRNESTALPASSVRAQPNADCSSDAVLSSHLKDLGETRAEAEEFTPGLRNYYVSTLSDRKNIYLEAALLPNVRAEWLKRWPADFVDCMNPALDGLAAAARKTIAGFHGPVGYTLGTPAEKKALTTAINDIAQGKVLRSGVKQASWLIDKNSYGLPTSRYKHGYLLVNYPNGGHSFCWVFWVNLVQDYAGGGTYGATYGNYVGRDLAGCPKA